MVVSGVFTTLTFVPPVPRLEPEQVPDATVTFAIVGAA